MNKSKNGLTRISWVFTIIILLIVLIVGYFIFVKKIKINSILSKNSNQNTEQTYTKSVEDRLVEAQARADSEIKVLENMVIRSRLEKEKTAELRSQYTIVNGLLEKKTNSLFLNSKSSNPQIKIDLIDNNIEKNINSSHKNVQNSLNNWKAILDSYNNLINQKPDSNNKDLSLSDIIKTSQKSITSISEYINQLNSLFNNLSTENSNLSQTQIDTYKTTIKEAVKDLEKIKTDILSEDTKNQELEQKPVITNIQIKAQEQVVEQLKKEVVVIENEASEDEDSDNQEDQPIDTIPPTVLLNSPKSGAELSYGVLVGASATDNTGIAKIEFYAGQTLIGTDLASPYSIIWDTSSVSDGNYSLTAKAYDASGNIKTSSTISVITSNGSNPLDNINISEDPELIEGANSID